MSEEWIERFRKADMDLLNKITELERKLEVINDDNIRIFKDIQLSLEANLKRIEKLENQYKEFVEVDHGHVAFDQIDQLVQNDHSLHVRIEKLEEDSEALHEAITNETKAHIKELSGIYKKMGDSFIDERSKTIIEIEGVKETIKALGGFSNEHAEGISELVAELMDNMKKAVQKPLIEEFLADLGFLRDAKRRREIEERWEKKLAESGSGGEF